MGGGEVGLGLGGGGLGPGGTAVTVPIAVADAVGVAVGASAGSQICWPMLSKILSRQLTCMICSTVVLVASPRAERESLA